MPACVACGTANPPHATFCLACGVALAAAPRTEARRIVTVVFSDIVGSTALGERLDPETVRSVIGRFAQVMRTALESHGGTVAKFIGDAVMAVFGVPELREDDALRAVRAAAEMAARLEDLNVELEARFGIGLRTRTGVNTGVVIAGAPGVGASFVVGDAVNVAARLEQAAGPGEILLGPDTHALVRDAVRVEAVEPLAVKGKSEPVPAVRLIGVEPAALRRGDVPLVGRETELERLATALARARDERTCVLATILGTPGVGKTRLARELCARARPSARVLEGRCLSYGEGITFWPLADVIKSAAGVGDGEPRADAERKLRVLVGADDEDAGAVLDRIMAIVGLGEAPAEPGELFWAARRVLRSLAGRRPLVVVFDDIHWAEPLFLDFVESLAGVGFGAPLLVLCVARPDLLEARPAWGTTAPGAVTLRLEPLGPAEARLLMQHALGGGTVPDEVAAQVMSSAAGNALFVEELSRMLVGDGVLRRQDGGWVATRALDEIVVPPTIHALLAARLERLAAPERGVLERASVIGQVFWWGAVSELAQPAWRPQLGGHLQALARRELIRRDESTFAGEEAFRFGHVLVRDVAYQGILRALRSELHAQFAAWLERRVGERVEEYEEIVGYHLEQAFRQQQALGVVDPAPRAMAEAAARRLASAGRRAARRGDIAATLNLLGRALDLWEPDEPERLEVLPDLAVACAEAGELDRAREMLEEALDGARRRGHELTEWRTRLQITHMEATAGGAPLAASLEQAEEAVEAFERLDEPADLARAWALIGLLRGWSGNADGGLQASERALASARRVADRGVQGEAVLGVLLNSYMGSTPAPEALRHSDEVLAAPTADPRQRAVALAQQVPLLGMLGRFADAREAGPRARGMLEELGMRALAASEATGTGLMEMLAGRPDIAERHLRASRDALESMGAVGFLSSIVGQLADAVLEQGRPDEADDLAEECRRWSTDDDIDPQARWRRVRARVLAGRGEHGEAERLAREAVDLCDATDFLNDHADALMDLARVLRSAGRPGDAARAADRALAHYERKGNVVAADHARAAVEQLVVADG